MHDRIPEQPPLILPVDPAVQRPLWSVMIPAYNCLPYLGQALESVLSQDPGPALMQIEVIDDASTDGNVEELVRNMGKGRVGYYRQPENRGSLRNFETCLQRAKGELVHLLHGDDAVLPGFYAAVDTLFTTDPNLGMVCTRYAYIDHSGKFLHNGALVQNSAGRIDDWLVKLASLHGIQPPGVVVKRSVYEALGGFYAVHYGEDWEMWCRIAKDYPVAYHPEVLAYYRQHGDNISSRSLVNGQVIKDIRKVIGLIAPMLPEQERRSVTRAATRHFSRYFMTKATGNFWKDRQRWLGFAWKVLQFDPSPAHLVSFGTLCLRYVYSFARQGIKSGLGRLQPHD